MADSFTKEVFLYLWSLSNFVQELTKVSPCISKEWDLLTARYKYGRTIYNIKIKNPNGKSTGVNKFKVNGEEKQDKCIKLIDDGKIYEIDVEM